MLSGVYAGVILSIPMSFEFLGGQGWIGAAMAFISTTALRTAVQVALLWLGLSQRILVIALQDPCPNGDVLERKWCARLTPAEAGD